MNIESLYDIKIEKTKNSKLSTLNFNNIPFGNVFSDHMAVADYENGEWTGSIIPYQNLSLDPATTVLHYAQSIFEGMKGFSSKMSDKKILFRPIENARRLNVSAERMCMPNLPEDLFMQLLTSLVDVDRNWIPPFDKGSLYIRPFLFGTDVKVGVAPSQKYKFLILLAPSGEYYTKLLKLKIEKQFSRAVKGGTGYAKAAGNYAGSLYPAKLASQEGYDQLIWTDAIEHKYIEEAGTMNLMFVIDNVLITPAINDTILNGITRKSIIQLAKDWGMKVEERRFGIDELVDALKKGRLQEAFGAGTAVVVTNVGSIGNDGTIYQLPPVTETSFSKRALAEIKGLTSGTIKDTRNWILEI